MKRVVGSNSRGTLVYILIQSSNTEFARSARHTWRRKCRVRVIVGNFSPDLDVAHLIKGRGCDSWPFLYALSSDKWLRDARHLKSLQERNELKVVDLHRWRTLTLCAPFRRPHATGATTGSIKGQREFLMQGGQGLFNTGAERSSTFHLPRSAQSVVAQYTSERMSLTPGAAQAINSRALFASKVYSGRIAGAGVAAVVYESRSSPPLYDHPLILYFRVESTFGIGVPIGRPFRA